jgi:hypothetical protein
MASPFSISGKQENKKSGVLLLVFTAQQAPLGTKKNRSDILGACYKGAEPFCASSYNS